MGAALVAAGACDGASTAIRPTEGGGALALCGSAGLAQAASTDIVMAKERVTLLILHRTARAIGSVLSISASRAAARRSD
jgi:hypothetical protein